MKLNFKTIKKINAIIIIALFFGCCFSVYAELSTTNSGVGKPKAMDIYISNKSYTASVAGNVTYNSDEEVPNEFKVIKDDVSISEPDWFTGDETPNNTTIATTEIPVDEDGPGKQLCVQDNTTDVIVEFAFSRAGYKNTFILYSPKTIPLGWTQGDNLSTRVGTEFGKTWNLGAFPAGTELIFADTANGKTYYTGPASRNPDKIIHGAVSVIENRHKYLVTFEDYWNGGDKDYNDVEFYVTGNLSTDCSTEGSSESEGGSVIPVYIQGSACKCKVSSIPGKTTCVAQFTYTSTADNIVIPIHESSLPWNEFSGSGMVKQDRCQPTTFYIDSRDMPFWTNQFWDNIKWKLGSEQSVLVKCEKKTPLCKNQAVCTECAK